MALVVWLVVWLGVAMTAHDAEAQPNRIMANSQARVLAKGCGRTSSLASCVRSGLDGIADLVLAELKTPQTPERTKASNTKAGRRVVWDGTFAHPDAPNFYTLKRLAPASSRTSEEACLQLPDALKADSQLLLKLTCEAERELLTGGANQWPEEVSELQAIRTRFRIVPASPDLRHESVRDSVVAARFLTSPARRAAFDRPAREASFVGSPATLRVRCWDRRSTTGRR